MFESITNLARAAVSVAVAPVALVVDVVTLPESALDPHRHPFERTIIAGSRGISDFKTVVEAIEAASLFEGIVPTSTLSGVAGGVDRLGERWAAEQGLACRLCPPDWKQGPTAGFARNYTMAQGADALIAVWDGRSTGTKHMIELARKYGLAVYVHHISGQ